MKGISKGTSSNNNSNNSNNSNNNSSSIGNSRVVPSGSGSPVNKHSKQHSPSNNTGKRKGGLLSNRNLKKTTVSMKLKTKNMDARSEILRNTAINSFRVDEKPTKQLILTRMKELRAREKKQKEIAAYRNLIALQMRSLLPAFDTNDTFVEEDEDDDEDFLGGEDDGSEEEEEDSEEEGDEEFEFEEDEAVEAEDTNGGEEEEEDDESEDEDEDEDGDGIVEDLVDLGDQEAYGRKN